MALKNYKVICSTCEYSGYKDPEMIPTKSRGYGYDSDAKKTIQKYECKRGHRDIDPILVLEWE